MEYKSVLEMLGYLASVIVAVSLTMKSIRKLRWYNFAGAVIMSAYGFLIASLPVAFLNLFIAAVDLYYLWQMYLKKEYYKLLEMPADRVYLDYFLSFYKEDIKLFFPNFDFQIKEDHIHLIVLRNMMPAGLMIGKINGESLEIVIEYAIPEFRDNKIGQFLFCQQCEFFLNKGVRRIISKAHSEAFVKYITAIGFRKTDMDIYQKEMTVKW
jgi:hypothetical protein